MAGATAECPLKVMSFNLRNGLARDGENAWPKRKGILIDTVKHCDPDIMGIQECFGFQAEYLAENLPDYRWIGIGRDANGGSEIAAVFYRTKLLVPIESGNFWLSETPEVPGSRSWDSSLNRIATWVRFHAPKTGTFFHVFNTHFDHIGHVARERSAALLCQRAAHLEPDYPVIVLGDFNARAESTPPWDIFAKNGFKDAWLTAEDRSGPPGTFHGWTVPDSENTSRIDWILHRGPVAVQHCETITYNKQGRYPSDHCPVLARLTIHQLSKGDAGGG